MSTISHHYRSVSGFYRTTRIYLAATALLVILVGQLAAQSTPVSSQSAVTHQPNHQAIGPPTQQGTAAQMLVRSSLVARSIMRANRAEVELWELKTLDDRTWKLIDGIVQAIDENGLHPPVRQQMMLAAARAIYQLGDHDPPSDLRHQVSQLTTDEQFRKWLGEHWSSAEISSNFDADTIHEPLGRRIVQQIEPAAMFVSAKANRVNQQLKENQYVGIGIQIKWESDHAMIVVPFPGGPARMAGAREGDLIINVDGKDMQGFDLGQVVEALRGAKGTAVSVTVRHKDETETRVLEMVRGVVPIASVQGYRQRDDGRWIFTTDKPGEPAYLRIDSIVGSTAAELQQAARDIRNSNSPGVILDLRQLRDADMHQATMVADVFVGQTRLGQLETNDSIRELQTRDDQEFNDIPIAVLTEDQVSGPVFLLLSALERRPQTCLIGKSITSNLHCYDTFELVDDLGAISHLPFARFLPPRKQDHESPAVHDSAGPLPTPHLGLIEPTIKASDEANAIEIAKEWLPKNVSFPTTR